MFDYYRNSGTTVENKANVSKKNSEGSVISYWLRSSYSSLNKFFLREIEGSCEFFTANTPLGVAPAFRIG